MKFSKNMFKQNASKDIQKKLNKHLDILEGKEVIASGDYGEIDYTFNGQGYTLYPVYKEWCV